MTHRPAQAPTLGEIWTSDPAMHAKLVNWGRWAKPSNPTGHCLSVEHRYRRRGESTDDHDSDPIDEQDAEAIERCITAPLFPARARLLLKAHFIMRADWRSTCRVLRVAQVEYVCEILRAMQLVRVNLAWQSM